MFKKLLAFFAAMYMAVSFAAVDVNKATAAELDGIKGIGPSISGKIIDERKKGNFKDWGDFISRVKGIGEGNAAKFSSEGLTIGGAGFKGAAAAPAASKKDAKPVVTVAPTAKAEEKKAETKSGAAIASTAATAPTSAAKEVKKDPRDEAKTKAETEKAAKTDAKKAKDTKLAAKDDAKADATSPAASAAKK